LESAVFCGRIVVGTCASGRRTRGFQEDCNASRQTGKQFQEITLENIDFTIHVGNEEFFGRALQRESLQAIATIRRSFGKVIRDRFQTRNPFRGEGLIGLTAQISAAE
jgi:hypothetical protein